MTTDKELLMWKNRAGEAEQKRIAAENRANKLSAKLDTARKALGEGIIILSKLAKADIYDGMGFLGDDKHKFSKSEFTHAKNMLSGARSNIEPKMELGVALKKGKEIKPSAPPPKPKTNDWYMDEEGNLHFYYLGRWHKGRKDE